MAVEQVSTDILKILGLEETDEIDMQSYKGYLREKLVEISVGKGGLSRDEEMAVREEFQRVKGKTNSVKVKKTTINPRAVFSGKTGGAGLVKYRAPAAGSLSRRVLPKENFVDDNAEILGKIDSLLNDIWKNLSEEEARKKKNERDKKARKDKEDKTAKESSLEKTSKGIVNALEKTFKPVIGIFQRIRDAIGLLLLGWVANTLIDWISDPKNITTFNAIVDFLSRNAGKLLLLYVALNNPLVKVVRWLGRNLIKFLVRMIADLAKGKGLLSGLRRGRGGRGLLGAAARIVRNPFVAVPLAVTGAAVAANEVTGQRQAGETQAENKARAQAGRGLGLQGVGGVGDMGAASPYGMLQGVGEYDDGGVVEGPSGIDRVPANLTEGEIVFSKPAVKTFGEDFLLSMNKLGGGTNRPTYSGGRMYASGGGLILHSSGGGLTPLSAPVNFNQLRKHHGTGDSVRKYGITKDYIIDGPKYPNYNVPTPVDAIVKYAGVAGGYGNAVELVDSNGKNLALFGHFSKLFVKSGETVKAGKFLGVQGSTGESTGPHVHIEGSKRFHEVWSNYVLGKKDSISAESLSGESSIPPGEDTTSSTESTQSTGSKGIVFASEEERRMTSAYLNYITQPFNARGIDVLPTIDQITGVPGGQQGQAPESSVLSGSAAKQDPQGVGAAAARQIVR